MSPVNRCWRLAESGLNCAPFCTECVNAITQRKPISASREPKSSLCRAWFILRIAVPLLATSKQRNFIMKNDTAVFAAMCVDAQAGESVWTGFTGTREAIRRDGYTIDPISLNFCPHEWIDSRGYVDLDLAQNAPLAETLPHGTNSL
jgi:hypothetical protein